jgi:hypothetical protein
MAEKEDHPAESKEEDSKTPEEDQKASSEIGPASGMPAGTMKTLRKAILILAAITFLAGGVLMIMEDPLAGAQSFVEGVFSALSPEAQVRSIALSNGMVESFIRNSTDSELHVSHFWRDEAGLIFEQMKEDCNLTNQTVGQDIVEVYRVMVDEQSSGRAIVAWVDWGTQSLVCVARAGNWTDYCKSRAYSQCYDNNFYWYNSCGDREEMKLSCFGICENNTCLPDCLLEGQDALPGGLECCEDFSTLPNSTVSSDGECIDPIRGSFVCTRCGNGLCQPPENECSCPEDCNLTCTDSDGFDNYTQGRVVRDGVEKWDFCINEKNLTEFYCEHKAIMNKTTECFAYYNYTCLFGRCVETEIPCIEEGDTAPNEEFYECCKGLTRSNLVRDPEGGCRINPTVFVCTQCGDGECGPGETLCNCNEDCHGSIL